MGLTNGGWGLRDWGEGTPKSLVSGEGRLWREANFWLMGGNTPAHQVANTAWYLRNNFYINLSAFCCILRDGCFSLEFERLLVLPTPIENWTFLDVKVLEKIDWAVFCRYIPPSQWRKIIFLLDCPSDLIRWLICLTLVVE